MTPGNIVALLGTTLVLAIVPGPSDIAVVARSVASGFTSALFMIVGIVATCCSADSAGLAMQAGVARRTTDAPRRCPADLPPQPVR
ncbi:hypothetical protein [Sorangium sp. So ce394]|uniref:hypothetical protein n=1 Tax=Sorangium sp. So ce394 TaxID=3133310 RepID=UPI003F5B3297